MTTDRDASTTPSFYTPGQAVVISATVLDSSGAPAPDALVTATVSMTTTDNPALATLALHNGGAGDVYTATLSGAHTTLPGSYVISVVASQAGVITSAPTDDSFVVSARTLTFSGQITFPSTVHQGDAIAVSGAVYSAALAPDAVTLALDDVDSSGTVLSTLGTQVVSNIPAQGSQSFNMTVDSTALGVGAHHLRLRLIDLPSDEDPASTTVVTGDVQIAAARPAMQVAPNPVTILVPAGSSQSTAITVTNPAPLAALQGITMTLSDEGNAQARPPSWLTLSATSLPDVAAGGSAGFAITANPSSSIAPGVYQTYLVVGSSNAPSQAIPLTIVVDSGRHGSMRFVVTDGVGQAVPDAQVLLTEQSAPYTQLNATSDAHGQALVASVSAGIPYSYTVTAPGFELARDNIMLDPTAGVYTATASSPATTPSALAVGVRDLSAATQRGYRATTLDLATPQDTTTGAANKTVYVSLTPKTVDAQWSVTPITIKDTYNTTLHLTFQPGPEEPALVILPQHFQFNSLHPRQSGTLSVYNPSTVHVSNVVVSARDIAGVAFTLTYTDTQTGQVSSGAAITVTGIAALSHVEIHYDATAICPPGYSSLGGSVTASGTYQYLPIMPALALDNAHGRGVTGSTAQDMVIHMGLTNVGYDTTANLNASPNPGGNLHVDTPSASDLGDLDPNAVEPISFTLHTQNLSAGVYTSTVAVNSGYGQPSTLAFTATVDSSGAVGVDYDYTESSEQPRTASVSAMPASVGDASCLTPPSNPGPAPVVVFNNGILSIVYGGSVPPLEGFSIPPMPQPGANEAVQLEIAQRTTFTRQAFAANLRLTDVAASALQDVGVSLHVTDVSGADRTTDFAITPPTTSGYSAGGGLGAIASGASADNAWTLIPDANAGGTTAAGQVYSVTASYVYIIDGTLVRETTQAATITVYPMPQLRVSYVIPQDIIAFQPFKLGVIVQNTGYGPVNNLSIESGQPVIVGNASGTFIHFTLLSASLAGAAVPVAHNSLTLPFGSIAPGQSKAGYWTMITDQDGRFTNFAATYQEQPYDGVPLSPLIQSEGAYIVTRGDVAIGEPVLQLTSTDSNNPTADPALSTDLIDLVSGDTLPVTIEDASVSQYATTASTVTVASAAAVPGYLLALVPDAFPPTYPLTNSIIQITARDDGGTRVVAPQAYWQQNGKVFILDYPAGNVTYSIDYLAPQPHTPILSVAPDVVPADGVSTATITLSHAPAGDQVRLISSRGSIDTFSTDYGTTNASGAFTATISSTTPGTSILTAQDLATGQTFNTSVQVAFGEKGITLPPTTGAVDIIAINSQIPLNGRFLPGIPLPNRIHVTVNWKGTTPGWIDFILNGVTYSEPANAPGASHIFDMGFDLRPGGNSLHIVAYNAAGQPSDPFDAAPYSAALPSWLTGLVNPNNWKVKSGFEPSYGINIAIPSDGIDLEAPGLGPAGDSGKTQFAINGGLDVPTTCTGPIDLSAEAGLEKSFKFLGVTLGGQVTASGDLGADVRQCAIDTTTISGAVKVGLTVFGEKKWPVLVFVVDYITPGAGDALQEALPSDLLSILGNVYIRGSLSGTFGAEAMTTSASSPWLQWHDIMFGGGPGIKAGYTWDQEELGTSLDLSLGLSGVASFASSPGRLVGNLSDLHFDNVTVTGEASMEYAIGGFGQKFPYTVQFTYSPNGVRSSAARLAPRPHIKKSVLYAIPHITAHDYARFQGAGKRQTFASFAARIPQSDIDGQNTLVFRLS